MSESIHPRVLIICRVDTISNAPSWAKATNKAYDCILSQYGSGADLEHHYFAGGKWIGIHDLLDNQPDLLNKYDYFWLPDDDIETSPEDIVSFFNICRSEGFELAQPALKLDSVHAYRLTLGNPRFKFRLTNFVELMMPLIERKLLQKLLPLFAHRHAALGIDWMWHSLTSKPHSHVAIVDEILMGHYRPRNKYLATRMNELHGVDIWAERQQTLQDLNINQLRPLAHAGKLINNQRVKSFRLAFETINGYFSVRNQIKHPKWSFKNYLNFLSF